MGLSATRQRKHFGSSTQSIIHTNHLRYESIISIKHAISNFLDKYSISSKNRGWNHIFWLRLLANWLCAETSYMHIISR